MLLQTFSAGHCKAAKEKIKMCQIDEITLNDCKM